MSSDLDILMDMMPDDNIIFDDTIEQNKPNDYYQGKGIHILKQLKEKNHYFHFMKSIVTQFHILDEDQKKILKETMGIQPEIVYKNKIIYQEKKQKIIKPKINNFDDY